MAIQIDFKRSWTVIGSLVILLASIAATDEFQQFLKILPASWLPIVTGLIAVIMAIKRIFFPSACIQNSETIPNGETLKANEVTISNAGPLEEGNKKIQ